MNKGDYTIFFNIIFEEGKNKYIKLIKNLKLKHMNKQYFYIEDININYCLICDVCCKASKDSYLIYLKIPGVYKYSPTMNYKYIQLLNINIDIYYKTSVQNLGVILITKYLYNLIDEVANEEHMC